MKNIDLKKTFTFKFNEIKPGMAVWERQRKQITCLIRVDS